MFGGQIDAELIGGIVKLDASGNMIPDTDTTTPVVGRVFFAGLSGSFAMAGIGGFSIQLALSELGPLSVVLGVTLPTGITLDPDTGLTINNFVGGVQFFQTLPSLTDPIQLRHPDAADARLADAGPVARVGEAAGRQPVQGEPRASGSERLGRRVHLADDDHRLGDRLLDLHVAGAVQRPGDDRDLDRRQVPRDREAELRREQPQRQRPPLRGSLEHQLRRRDRALPRRRARPGADPDPVREAADGLQEHPGAGGRVHRARPAAGDADSDARRACRRRDDRVEHAQRPRLRRRHVQGADRAEARRRVDHRPRAGVHDRRDERRPARSRSTRRRRRST